MPCGRTDQSSCQMKHPGPLTVTSAKQESLGEAKAKQDLLSVAVAAADELDDLLEKSSQW